MFDQTQQAPYGNGAIINNGFQPQGAGYQFNGYGQQPVPKVMNFLTEEEIKKLQQQGNQFSLGLTEREILQARCNHRSINGMEDTLVYDNETGQATCTICGYQFKPIDPDIDNNYIQNAVDTIIDILQTTKIMYTDIPAQAASEYYTIIPLIGKLPELFKFAAKNLAKHEFNAWNYNNRNMGGMAMLNNLNSIFGAPQGGYMQQPMMGGMPQQPMGMPMGYPQQAYAQAPQGNPFGYAGASQAPAQGYQPQTTGFQYQPQQAAPAPVATTVEAPAPAPEATVTQAVTV